MSGIIETGTSSQAITLTANRVYTWQHNRGQKPLLVKVVSTGNAVSVDVDLNITCPDDNSITVEWVGELEYFPVVILVTWGVTTLSSNSIQPNGGFQPPPP